MKHKLKLALILGVEFVAIAIVLVLIFLSGKKQYTVVFNIEGGTLLSGNLEQRVTQGHSATAPSVAKEGHYLRGWSGNYREVTHDIEIKAIWEYETTPGIAYNTPSGATYTEIRDCFDYLCGKVYIGAYHNNLKVLSITSGAFENCSRITDLYLLDGILSIGDRAFAECSQLTNIELPNSTISMGNEVFAGCKELVSVTLPKSLEKLGANAFAGCDSLVEIFIPETIKTIDENAFAGCSSLEKVVFYKIEEEKDIFAEEDEEVLAPEIVTPEPIMVIGAGAFLDCTALSDIALPETLHTIGANAFSGCTSLKALFIPEKTKNIGTNAFDTDGMEISVYALSALHIPRGWAINWAADGVTVLYNYLNLDIPELPSLKFPIKFTGTIKSSDNSPARLPAQKLSPLDSFEKLPTLD